MSVTGVGGFSIPDPGYYSGGDLSVNLTPPTPAPTTPSPSSTPSTYQTEYLNLQQYDTSELLYASFLSPAAGLANADSVLGQAATLLDGGSSPAATSSSAASTSATSGGTSGSSSSTTAAAPDPLASIPSVASILAASDQAAQQTLSAYAAAPAGSSILDFQA